MLSLLGSLLGFGGSVIPGILDSFKKKQDQKYELKKLEVQAQINRENLEHQAKIQKEMGKQKFELFQAQAKDKEHERLIQHDIVLQQGTGFISGLARSVRPIITYAFFLLFAVIEGTLLYSALQGGTDFQEAINILWDEDTKAIFAAIISFWFGSRAIDKNRSRYSK